MRRQLVPGLVLLIVGLLVVAIGAVVPSSDPVVALGWLLLVPMLVSFVGTVLLFLGLARNPSGGWRFAGTSRIVGLSAVAGLGLALAFGAAGILSQVPDSLAGLNGPYVPGSGSALSAFFLCGLGVLAGALIGVVASVLLRWFRPGRLERRSISSE